MSEAKKFGLVIKPEELIKCKIIGPKFVMDKKMKSAPVGKLKLTVLSFLGIVLATSAVLLAAIHPLLLVAKRGTHLSPGSPLLEILKKKHQGVTVETYLFNITNVDRFLSGEDPKMKVEEVGPFTYVETRFHENLELDEAAGVLRYTPRTTVHFNRNLSIADPTEVNVTMPNIALLSMTSMLSSFSSWTKIPFDLLVRRLRAKSVVTIDAHNYLWGYDEPLIRFGNTVMPGWINFKRLGIMDRLYDSSLTFNLEVGAKDEDKFLIKTINGTGGLKPIGYGNNETQSKCNTYSNTYEGIGYPPGMTPDSEVRIWRNVMCRILETDFTEIRTTDYGVDTLVYKISNRTYDYNPDKACLCAKGACYNGMSDLSPCFFGLPLAISNAHFLDAEPRLFRKIDGLNPDEKKHGSEFVIEPITGTVIDTRFTVQVNVVVNDVSFNNEASPFSDMVVPIAYFKIVKLPPPDELKSKLRVLGYIAPMVLLTLEIIMFGVGISLIFYCLRQICMQAMQGGIQKGMAFTTPTSEKAKPPSEIPLMKNTNS